MAAERKVIGNRGEDLAAAFLRSRGFRILERQARVSRIGEIDIVALDGETIVFVEVKTRHSAAYGTPEEAVTASKVRTLAACAESWRNARGWTARPYRLDVVAVDLAGREPVIRYLESVGG